MILLHFIECNQKIQILWMEHDHDHSSRHIADYDRVKMAQLMNHAATYVATQKRDA